MKSDTLNHDAQKERDAAASAAVPIEERLAADEFRRFLYLERKRRERSGRRMCLLLIDLTGITTHRRDYAAGKVFQQLAEATRETDIKGWHSEGRIVGVIFTEINGFDRETMLAKIKAGLKTGLSREVTEQILFTFHDYPVPKGTGGDAAANPELYPEVQEKSGVGKGPFLVKRILDIVGSLTGLIIFAPFLIVIAALVKLSSPGPVLFRQERLGLYGRRFIFLKFRTMFVNNDPSVHQKYVKDLITAGKNGEEGNGVFKITNDSRITPIGRLLRKSSLDELPQFLNVLRGDMSLVGPRPPIPYEVREYDQWHLARIIEVKPGITGLWQVRGRSSTSFDEMTRLDIRYCREWSLWLDLKIIALTPWAVLSGKGAY